MMSNHAYAVPGTRPINTDAVLGTPINTNAVPGTHAVPGTDPGTHPLPPLG
jgi:hypothetical protein